MTGEQSTIGDWLQIIQGEYLEIPGLHLTKPQIRRLWGLTTPLCDALVDALVASHFLRRTDRNGYVLAGDRDVDAGRFSNETMSGQPF